MERFFDYIDKNDWAFVLFVIFVLIVAVVFVRFAFWMIREWDKKKRDENYVEKWRH